MAMYTITFVRLNQKYAGRNYAGVSAMGVPTVAAPPPPSSPSTHHASPRPKTDAETEVSAPLVSARIPQDLRDRQGRGRGG